MKFKKVFKGMLNLSLLVPIVSFTSSCNTQGYQVKNMNIQVAHILGLCNAQGKSLIKQIIYNDVSSQGELSQKCKFGISTNYYNSLFLTQYNLFANVNFNELIKAENIHKLAVTNFLINDLKVDNYHEVDFSKFKFTMIKYQPIFNKNINKFWVESTVATIAIVKDSNKSNNIISQYYVNVAPGEIPITKKSTFNLLTHDLVYTPDFYQPKVTLTAKKFNDSVRWNHHISNYAQADQNIADMLQVRIKFKISISKTDITGVVNEQELLKPNVCYYIALFIGDKFTWSNYVINYR